MFKIFFAALVGVAICGPATVSAQGYGCCEPDPCVQTRKRLAVVEVTRERCRLRMACVTDECGCTRRQLVRVPECVTRRKLAFVDTPVDPCAGGCFSRLRDRLGSRCCDDCCAPAPCDAGCGCGH